MKKFVLLTVCASLAVAFSQATVAAEAKKTITIAAEEPGGSWYAYSATIIKIVEANTPYKVEIIPRGGGIANASAVNLGKADFGFTTSNASAWARDGLQEVYKGKKHENIRVVLNGLQYAYELALARTSYIKKNGNDSLDKMLGAKELPRIVMEPTGSQDPIIASFILKPYKMSLDGLRKSNRLMQIGSSQIPDNIRDDKSDLFFVNAPLGQSTTTEVTLTNDITFVPMPDKVLDTLRAAGMPTVEMPAGVYKGQDKPYRTAASATILIANKSLPDDVVYAVTKALTDNISVLQTAHAPIKAWNPEVSVKPENLPIALHAGAAKFYKEKGWVK